ncbi:MAG: flagellar hook-length control protein FliK [Thermodesulfovibrionales bacterium]|nr:flagellar hook-length control protein FliK [Thermodesulfovibrionales bacterium]
MKNRKNLPIIKSMWEIISFITDGSKIKKIRLANFIYTFNPVSIKPFSLGLLETYFQYGIAFALCIKKMKGGKIMLIAPQQINNLNVVPKANDFQGIEGQSSGGGGSFISVLTSMMNGGDSSVKSLMAEFGNNGNPLDAMLQQLDDYEGLIDPLMISFIQQLLANPEQFQDAFKGNIVAADNNIHLIAQLNQGQFKDLAEFVQNLVSNQNANLPMTEEIMQQTLIEKLNRLDFKDNLTLAKGLKPFTSTEEALSPNEFDIKKVLAESNLLPQDSSEELVSISEKTITDNKAQNNLLDTLKVKNEKHFDSNSFFDKKGLAGEGNSKMTTIQETNLTAKALNEEFSELFKSDITVEEVQFGSSTKLANDINTDALSSTKTEAPQISAANNSQQNTHVKTEGAIKETLHVSRLQEIDSKIFKAIETGQKSLTVRLEPPELGSVHIKLVLTDGMVRADMKVDSAAVKDMMNLALPQIKNSLENAGIKVSEFFVDIREEYYSDGRQNQQDKDNSRNQKQQNKQKDDENIKPFEFYI